MIEREAEEWVLAVCVCFLSVREKRRIGYELCAYNWEVRERQGIVCMCS